MSALAVFLECPGKGRGVEQVTTGAWSRYGASFVFMLRLLLCFLPLMLCFCCVADVLELLITRQLCKEG